MEMEDNKRLSNSAFQRLLNSTSAASARAARLQRQVAAEFEKRYGAAYSDVDADGVIDAVDYGTCNITVTDCDEEMARSGFPLRREVKPHSPREPTD